MMNNTTWAVVKPSTICTGETALVCWCNTEESAMARAKEFNTMKNTTEYMVESVERFDTARGMMA